MSSSTPKPIDFTKFYNVINGKLDKGVNKRHTVNPATLDANPDVPVASAQDVDKAVQAAQAASEYWAKVPWFERKQALGNFVSALESHTDSFISMLVNEQGKPLFWARNEIETAITFLRGFCSLSLPAEIIEDTKDRRVTTSYVPIGVTVGIVPWNFPIHLACGKLGPALLTGNAFILKSSLYTPYCGLKLAELGMQFFPPGVFQALSGDDTLGPLLTTHPEVNMVSFTGSASNGVKVAEQCARTLKRLTLELSGNDPAIICADIDVTDVASKIALFAFCNAGQICMSVKRVYVHESIYDHFLSTMVTVAESFKVGSDAECFLGPVANEAQFSRLQSVYADVESKMLRIATGGTKPLQKKGYFFPATIVDSPPDDTSVVKEEQFGPIIPLLKWTDESDVVIRANSTGAGLGASVWTRDNEQAQRIANQLVAGNVWINTHAEIMPNTPFGGHKMSGIGMEWGVEGLKSYCNLRAVYTRLS